MAQKPVFQFFGIKFNVNRIKSATKFRCVKTSSGKVVEQSISYEITEKCRTESVSFHLKYWLKLTYPVAATTCLLAWRTLSALPNDVMSTIECGQVHSELFRRRHSTLQLHGLFTLAKHVFIDTDVKKKEDVQVAWGIVLFTDLCHGEIVAYVVIKSAFDRFEGRFFRLWRPRADISQWFWE